MYVFGGGWKYKKINKKQNQNPEGTQMMQEIENGLV